MKTTLKNIWTRLKSWLERWPETWAEPLGIVLFLATIPLFNWMLSASRAPEMMTLQNIIITGIEIAAINALAFIGILLNFSVIYDWYKKKNPLKSDWLKLEPWQRWLTFILLYLGFFLAGSLLFASLQ
jgi:hypothetical protein